MRSFLFLPSLLLATVLCYLPTYGSSEAEQASSVSARGESRVITITDSGISPSLLKMRIDDSIVFFVNSTEDSLLTLSLKFGPHATHCASSNLSIQGDGEITSTTPIAPKDFANACFHDAGSYTYTIFGLKNAPAGLKGTILVQ
jgi:hypothetical protein